MAIGIATPVLRDGDAVGNDALGMGRVLRGAGYDVHFFSRQTGVSDDVRPLEDMFRVLRDPDDVLIYHHSINCDIAIEAMRTLPAKRKIVKYHNVTPPRFFAEYSPKVAEGCAEGLKQVADLAAVRPTVWADSAFNARDFQAVANDIDVADLPPFHQMDKLSVVTPDTHAASGLDDWNRLILCVGRLAPNKNLMLAVDAFAEYRRKFDPDARLVLAGGPFPGYHEDLIRHIRNQRLRDHVLFTGKITLGQLKALYLAADALMVTSEHEGFCVPLVEAMCLRLPIVTVRNAAIPDTAGDAATYADATPASLAERLDQVLRNRGEREKQVARGVERYAERYTNEAIAKRLLKLLDSAMK